MVINGFKWGYVSAEWGSLTENCDVSNTSLTPASKPMPEIHVLKSLSDEEEWEYEDVSSKSDNFFLPQTPKERKYLRIGYSVTTDQTICCS